jgi:hypothetical protein
METASKYEDNPLKTEILIITTQVLVRTSQETHYVSTTETNLLKLFRVKIVVYCENDTKHKYIQWAKCKGLAC